MKINNKIGELLFQIVPVTIGVFLGYVISNWSENEQQESKKKILVTNIINEIKTNKENVLGVIEYHEIQRDSSRYYLNSEKKTEGSFFNGINTATLVNNAFETGIQTGLLNNLSIDRIQSFNRVYTYQKLYLEYRSIILTGLVSMDFQNDEESIYKLLNYLSLTMADVVVLERKLISEYDNILDNTIIEK